MRLGLLGLGRIGAFHAETLTSLPVVESVVVSDPVAALAAEAVGEGEPHIQTHQGPER
jgi:myo-inositol 2-dehydrogenase / D-chiro-inositol 1-dehydrogenase